MKRRRGRHYASVLSVLLGGLLAGCGLLAPLPRQTSVEQRLAAIPNRGLPLDHPVTIRWDRHQIPFVEAADDGDAAFALGLVHAHLRLGQMAVLKRIARGRIAEMGGPLATDVDHALRILDFGRAAADVEATLPAATRHWLTRFVEGVNHYQAIVADLPIEYRILALEREPWTVADVLAFGRLAGTDINWLVWANLLKLRSRPDWPQLWARLVADGDESRPGFDDGSAAAIGDLITGIGRTGSNSLALAPDRTRSGSAIMANDPHLGLNIPNTWLIAGLKSPSFHVVGLMVPGLPVFAIGRNPRISWGGTNMRAAASDLFDVSALPEGAFRERRERLRVRWWFDREVIVRETPYGPIVSDAPYLADSGLPPSAVHWTGHRASDEISALLAVSRARTFQDFRAAFRTFSVPGQNMLYADVDGNIGQVLAVQLPARAGWPPTDIFADSATADAAWNDIRDVDDLPASYNPPSGFLASANNRPAPAGIPIGTFFSPDDRVDRMASLVRDGGRLDLEAVKDLQQDVYMASSVALRDLVVRKMDDLGITAASRGAARALIERLRSWDGRYRADAVEPVAFELFRHAFTRGFYESVLGAEDWAAFANVGRIQSLLLEDIAATEPAALAALLRASMKEAAADLHTFADWGDMHRLELRHPLAFLPLVGGRFRFGEHRVGGSNDTLMKTAHALTDRRHTVRYGANARHISDLSDADRNYFVLVGGQDGWLNSTTFLDQVAPWLSGDYIQVPLRLETVRQHFPHVTTLTP